MSDLTIKSALRAGGCGASGLAPASDARSGLAFGQEGWASHSLVGQIFLRTMHTVGGAQPNKPLEPIPIGHRRFAIMLQVVPIAGAVWLSFFR